jgi:hypothetical protein
MTSRQSRIWRNCARSQQVLHRLQRDKGTREASDKNVSSSSRTERAGRTISPIFRRRFSTCTAFQPSIRMSSSRTCSSYRQGSMYSRAQQPETRSGALLPRRGAGAALRTRNPLAALDWQRHARWARERSHESMPASRQAARYRRARSGQCANASVKTRNAEGTRLLTCKR